MKRKKDTSKQKLDRELKKWNKKLADSGFIDIEYTKKGVFSQQLRGKTIKDYTEKLERDLLIEEYHNVLSYFAEHYSFPNPLEKEIFEMLAEGIFEKTIMKRLGMDRKTFKKLLSGYKLADNRRQKTKIKSQHNTSNLINPLDFYPQTDEEELEC
jgi:DNA-binding CsgD family transcriptional regulator